MQRSPCQGFLVVAGIIASTVVDGAGIIASTVVDGAGIIASTVVDGAGFIASTVVDGAGILSGLAELPHAVRPIVATRPTRL